MQRLTTIKLIHTLIWTIEVLAISYIVYSGFVSIFNGYVIFAFAMVGLEGVILIQNKWRCPLTVMAEPLTNNTEIGFDIFLPKWLAKYNKTIFTTLFLIGIALYIVRFFLNCCN